MPSNSNGIADALLTGWIVTWPTKLLALIWLAWVVSWVVAAFWSGRTKAHVPTWDSWVYRLPILIGAIFLMPLTARLVGAAPLYHVGNLGTYVLALVTVLQFIEGLPDRQAKALQGAFGLSADPVPPDALPAPAVPPPLTVPVAALMFATTPLRAAPLKSRVSKPLPPLIESAP